MVISIFTYNTQLLKQVSYKLCFLFMFEFLSHVIGSVNQIKIYLLINFRYILKLP